MDCCDFLVRRFQFQSQICQPCFSGINFEASLAFHFAHPRNLTRAFVQLALEGLQFPIRKMGV